MSTGLPIDSAMIQLRDTVYGIVDYSDSTGQYTTGDLGYGTWRLFCRKSGYATAWIDVTSTRDRTRVEGADIQLSQ